MKKNKHKKIVEKSMNDKVLLYMQKIDDTAKGLDMKVSPVINFKKGKPSLVGRFALFLLRRSGGFLDTQFTNLKK